MPMRACCGRMCATLRQLGLNGYISCQQTRVFWPCGFGMHVLGQTLWNRETDFEAMAGAYFEALFASRAGRVRAMMQAARRFHPECLRGERPSGTRPWRRITRRSGRTASGTAPGAPNRPMGHRASRPRCGRPLSTGVNSARPTPTAWRLGAGLEDEREIRLAGLRQVVRIGEPAHQEMLDVYWFLKTLDRTVLPVL